jgi:ribosome-binding factor A
MHKISNRPERVAELLRREIARLLAREVHDEAVHGVTITDAEVARDLKSARVYFSLLAGKAASAPAARALNRAAGFLRHALRHRLSMKNIPELRFFFDDSLERGAHMDRLIDQALRRDRGEDR